MSLFDFDSKYKGQIHVATTRGKYTWRIHCFRRNTYSAESTALGGVDHCHSTLSSGDESPRFDVYTRGNTRSLCTVSCGICASNGVRSKQVSDRLTLSALVVQTKHVNLLHWRQYLSIALQNPYISYHNVCTALHQNVQFLSYNCGVCFPIHITRSRG